MSTGSSTNSSTGSAVKGDGGFASARNSADRATPVRWIVLFTGRTATDDYQPSATDGEKPALVKEVTDLCVAFHPHSDIRLFPQSGDALLFYRAKSTGEWVITRVATAPNPDGVRTALEYCSIVLSEGEFQRLLGGNPFAADDAGGMLDRVREHFLAGEKTPIGAAPMPSAKGRTRTDLPAPADPAIDADALATPDNARILQEFFAARVSAGVTTPPPTFTTWWSSGGSVPSGYFDIVLRARATRAISLRDAADATTHLASEVKAALPRTTADDTVASDLARSILANADAAQQAVSHATSHLNTETPAQFQAQLTEAARLTAQITADIAALKGRLGTALSSDAATRLTDLSDRSSELSRDLPRVRHPNPFARRNTAPEPSVLGALAATANATAPTAPVAQAPTKAAPARSNNNAILGGVAAVVVIGGLAVFGLMGRGNHNSASPTPGASTISNPANGGVAVKPPKPANPAAVALTGAQTTVEPIAKDNALKAVAAALKTAKGVAVPDATIETIAAASITSAYKDTLTPAQLKTVYGNGKPWTYSHYKTVVPSLAISIHEATIVAATEGVAAQKIKKVEATAAAATPKPQPHDNPPPDETPAPKKHPKRETSNSDSSSDEPKPRKHPTESTAPATPKAGSAAQTGL